MATRKQKLARERNWIQSQIKGTKVHLRKIELGCAFPSAQQALGTSISITNHCGRIQIQLDNLSIAVDKLWNYERSKS